MKVRASGRRRNPPRRCRNDALDRIEKLPKESGGSDSSSEQNKADHEEQQPKRKDSEDPLDFDYNEFAGSKPEESRQEEAESSDYEEELVKPVNPKKRAKLRNQSQRKRTAKNHAEGNRSASDTDRPKLSAKQTELLDEIFADFDIHNNGRITLSDVLRVAHDHGLEYSTEEARDMVRFWDTSGTLTVSCETFRRLVIEAKFMVPSAK